MRHYRDWITPIQMRTGLLTCWPGTLDSAVTLCIKTGRIKLSAEFEAYTQNKDNWTVNTLIRGSFPEVSELGIRVREETSVVDGGGALSMHGIETLSSDATSSTGGASVADAKRTKARGKRRMDADVEVVKENILIQDGIARELKQQRLSRSYPE